MSHSLTHRNNHRQFTRFYTGVTQIIYVSGFFTARALVLHWQTPISYYSGAKHGVSVSYEVSMALASKPYKYTVQGVVTEPMMVISDGLLEDNGLFSFRVRANYEVSGKYANVINSNFVVQEFNMSPNFEVSPPPCRVFIFQFTLLSLLPSLITISSLFSLCIYVSVATLFNNPAIF